MLLPPVLLAPHISCNGPLYLTTCYDKLLLHSRDDIYIHKGIGFAFHIKQDYEELYNTEDIVCKMLMLMAGLVYLHVSFWLFVKYLKRNARRPSMIYQAMFIILNRLQSHSPLQNPSPVAQYWYVKPHQNTNFTQGKNPDLAQSLANVALQRTEYSSAL